MDMQTEGSGAPGSRWRARWAGGIVAAVLWAAGAWGANLISGVVCVTVTGKGPVPVGVGQAFPATARELHAVVDVDGLEAGDTVRAEWIAVDALQTPNAVVATAEVRVDTKGFRRLHFSVELERDKTWPPGRYRVNLSVGEQGFGSVPYEIFPAQRPLERPFAVLVTAKGLDDQGSPVGLADEFPADAPKLVGVAWVDGLRKGDRVRLVWRYTGRPVAEGRAFGQEEVEAGKDGAQQFYFAVNRKDPTWPEGWYRFEAYQGERLLAWMPFFVYPARSAAGEEAQAQEQAEPGPASQAPSGTAPEAPAGAGGERLWTVLVYLDGDNNLEPFALKDLDEMERALPAGKAEVIVLLDRAEGYSDAEGDWKDARILRVRRDARAGLRSEVLARPGELNLGDPAVLQRFVEQGIRSFPARHYALILWNHGGGWASHISDEAAPGAPNGDHLTLPELRKALEGALRSTGLERLDLVGFDMCLMGQIETAYELEGVADVLVASEAVEPGDGWPYDQVLPLFGREDLSPKEVARGIVEAYDRFYRGREEAVATLSALDLLRAEETVRALDGLLDRIRQGLDRGGWTALTRTLFFSEGFAPLGDMKKGEKALASIDLGNALANLARLDPAIGSSPEYRAFEQALEGFVLENRTSPRHRASRGVAAYAPVRKSLLNRAYRDTRFARESGWLRTLEALYRFQAEQASPPEIWGIETFSLYRNKRVGEVLHLGQDGFRFSYEGTNLLYAYVFLGDRDGAKNRTLIYQKTFLRREGLEETAVALPRRGRSEVLQIYSHPDGRHDVGFRYDGTRAVVSDGRQTLPLTLDDTDISKTVAHVRTAPVLYIDPKYGRFFATVYFNWLGRASSVVVEIPRKDGTVVYAEVDPPPEAKIQPLLEALRDDGKVEYVPTGEMEWGEHGPFLSVDLVPPGEYEVILALETVTGQVKTARHRFRVAARSDDLLANVESVARELTAENLAGVWELIDPNAWFQARQISPMGGFLVFEPHPRIRGVLRKRVEKPRGQDLFKGLHVVTVIRPEGLPHLVQYVLDDQGVPRRDYGYAMSYVLFDAAGGQYVMLSLDLQNGELQVYVKRSGPEPKLEGATGAPSVPAGQQPGGTPGLGQQGPATLDGIWQAGDGTAILIQGNQWVYYEAGQPVDQGMLVIQGDQIAVQSFVTGDVLYFRFQLAGNRLLLQDASGGLTQYTRVR